MDMTIFSYFSGGFTMSEKEYAALRDALASSCIEGFKITTQTEQDCKRLIRGKMTVDELVREILVRPLPKAV